MDAGIFGRMGDSIRASAYSAKHQAITGIKKMPKKAFRGARRALTGAMVGGGAGLLALGAGAAMDPSKAMALTATAFSAGSNFGNYYGDKLAKGAEKAGASGRQAFWGKDFKAIEQANYDREFMRAPETIDALTKAMGSRSKALQAINSGDVQAFLKSNHTDLGRIGRALGKKQYYLDQAKKNGQEISNKQALQRSIAMASWARDIHPNVFNPNSREQIAWKSTLTQQLVEEGMNESDATKRVNEILGELSDING